MSYGKTKDEDAIAVLNSILSFGYYQPFLRELRTLMRRKIKSLIIKYGTPSI